MAPPRKLTVETIVATALDLLREGGLDAVTQRAVAQRLHVEAASLYRHIPSKERLLALVTLALFRLQIEAVGLPPTWQEWLIGFGQTLWRTQQDIPDCARLVLTTRFTAEDYAAMSRWATQPLTSYGVETPLARQMHLALQAIVLGLAGIADGPNSALVRELIAVDKLLADAVAALIAGWEARLSADQPPASK